MNMWKILFLTRTSLIFGRRTLDRLYCNRYKIRTPENPANHLNEYFQTYIRFTCIVVFVASLEDCLHRPKGFETINKPSDSKIQEYIFEQLHTIFLSKKIKPRSPRLGGIFELSNQKAY